jgi:membrane associated rhomboid family serine protease
MRQSPATAALIIAFIAVFVASLFDVDGRIFFLFAKIDDRIRAGEVWRLFTASFLHAGLMHLWFNGMALASVGPTIERVYGKPQFVLAFLLGGAAGMGASTILVPAPSVGASAGVFALLGVLLAYALRSRATMAPQARRFLITQVLVVVGLNVAIGLVARFIDNAAHIGGLVGGFVLGFVLRPREPLFPDAPPQASAPGRLDERSARSRGRSYLGWAGQRWKMVALFLGMAPMALFAFRSDHLPGWELLAFIASGFAGMMRTSCSIRQLRQRHGPFARRAPMARKKAPASAPSRRPAT